MVCMAVCAEGYYTNGSREMYVCDTSGTASMYEPLPHCAPQLCEYNFPSGIGINHTCHNVGTGSSCEAACGNGYRYLPGEKARTYTCKSDGELLGTPPACIAKECSPLVERAGQRSSCSKKVTGQECVADCHMGYKLIGQPSVLTCETSGVFGGVLPTCVPIPCKLTSLPRDSGLNMSLCNGAATGQTCTINCAQGYIGTSSSFSCLASGDFTGAVPTCAPLVCPVPSMKAGARPLNCDAVNFGSSCLVACEPGYMLGGDAQKWQCMWDRAANVGVGGVTLMGVMPDCEPIRCNSNIRRDLVGSSNCTEIATGQYCMVHCPAGFVGRPEMFQCLATGELIGEYPTCEPSTCLKKDLPADGRFQWVGNNCDALRTGESCSLFCGVGFEGPRHDFICMPTGMLNGSEPICKPRKCNYNLPPAFFEGHHNCSDVVTNQRCVVHCPEGFHGRSQALLCNSGGDLDDMPGRYGTCQALECLHGFPEKTYANSNNCSGIRSDQECIVSCPVDSVGEPSVWACSRQRTLLGVYPTCEAACSTPSDMHGSFEHLGGENSQVSGPLRDRRAPGPWKLTCLPDFMLHPAAGSFAFCSTGGVMHQPMPSCVPDLGCHGEDAMPVDTGNGVNASGTTCTSYLSEQDFCQAQCPIDFDMPLGSFRCVSGRMAGFSYCSARGENVAVPVQTFILGVLRIEVEVSSGVEELTRRARRSIAVSLGISDKYVVHVVVIACAAELKFKSLRGDHASVDVQYEVTVSAGMSEKDLAKAAYELTVDNSSENKRFQMVMGADGVFVDSVSTLVAPVSFQTSVPMQSSRAPVEVVPVARRVHSTCTAITTPPPNTLPRPDDDSDTQLAIAFGAVGGIVGLCCLLCCLLCCFHIWAFRRKGEM